MFLSLNDFLQYFPVVAISKEELTRTMIVTYAKSPSLEQLFSLRSVIKTVEDPRYVNRQQIIDYFYDVLVTHRHAYLTDFYQSYFAFPDPFQLKWDGVKILTPKPLDLQVISDLLLNYQQHPDLHRAEITQAFNQLLDQPLSSLSLQKNDHSRIMIRNLNYLDILDRTRVTNTCKSKTSFWESLINVYNRFQLEDRFFAPSSIGLFLREAQRKYRQLS